MSIRKTTSIAVAGGLVVAAGLSTALQYLPRREKPIQGKKAIICIGDSITFGAGVPHTRKRDAWPYLLSDLLGDPYQALNYGFSGATAQDTGDLPYHRTRFLKTALKIPAEAFLLMLGTNDSKPINWRHDGYEQAVRTMIMEIKNAQPHAKLFLLLPPAAFPDKIGEIAFGIRDVVIRDEILPILKNIAEEFSLETIDLYALTSEHPEYFTDGVHPNKAGNEAIASEISASLRKSLKKN